MKRKKGKKKKPTGRPCEGDEPLTNQQRQARRREKLLKDPEKLAAVR